MNLATITSILRHWITAAAGVLGLWLIAHLALTGAEADQLTAALTQLIEPSVAVLGLIAVTAARLGIAALGKIFGWGAGEIGDRASGIPLLIGLLGTAVVIGGSLPSCQPGQIEAFRAVPIKGCVITPEGKVCYSNTEGLSYEVDTRSGK